MNIHTAQIWQSFVTTTLFLLILAATLGQPVTAESVETPSLAATLNKTAFTLDDTALLTITINGSRSADIDMPEVANLNIDMRGQSVQMQMINGSYSASITANYSIQALKQGSYTLPAITVKVKDHLLTTEPITFQVMAGGTGNVPQSNAADQSDQDKQPDEAAFFLIHGLKDSVYTGETMPVEIKAYFQRGLRVELLKMPVISGEAFAMSLQNSEPLQSQEVYNGRNYSVVTWQALISPVKEGEFELLIDLDATLLIPQKNKRSPLRINPLFDDDFFNDFFGGYQRKNVKLATPRKPIVIEPLPQQGQPENFSGAIGVFDFTATASPTTINVGDPITLTMKITGEGNFDRVTAPQFSADQKWKTYTPTSHFEKSGSDYQGEKVFEQAIVAKNDSADAIPALTFSYFDPGKNAYISKTSQPITLHLNRKGTAVAMMQQPPTLQAQQTPQQLQTADNKVLSLAAIRLTAGDFRPRIEPVYKRAWFIAAVILCILSLLAILISTWRKNYLLNNVRMMEEIRVNRNIKEKIKILEQAIAANDASTFLQGIREIIQVRFGLQWNIEPSTITQNDLKRRLPIHAPITQIFIAAEQYAYGGAALTEEEMKDYLNLFKQEMEEL